MPQFQCKEDCTGVFAGQGKRLWHEGERCGWDEKARGKDAPAPFDVDIRFARFFEPLDADAEDLVAPFLAELEERRKDRHRRAAVAQAARNSDAVALLMERNQMLEQALQAHGILPAAPEKPAPTGGPSTADLNAKGGRGSTGNKGGGAATPGRGN